AQRLHAALPGLNQRHRHVRLRLIGRGVHYNAVDRALCKEPGARSQKPECNAAHALVRATSRLVSTLGERYTVPPCVATSGDVARTSACATHAISFPHSPQNFMVLSNVALQCGH